MDIVLRAVLIIVSIIATRELLVRIRKSRMQIEDSVFWVLLAFLCIFLGMTTGVGGGILRDILTREKPFILYKYVYALAVILGSSVYYALERLHARESLAMLAGMGNYIYILLFI